MPHKRSLVAPVGPEIGLAAGATRQHCGIVGLRFANPYMVSSRLARPCLSMTGTGLLSYIRPVGEGPRPSGLDEVRAYRPYRPIGVKPPSD